MGGEKGEGKREKKAIDHQKGTRMNRRRQRIEVDEIKSLMEYGQLDAARQTLKDE